MTNKLLEIKDLHVEYHTDDARVFAVNGIDLDVNEGETLGLVGETGAGKTTTALSVLKLLPERTGRITGGRVFLEGKDITNYTDADMRAIRGEIVSMIFQDPMTSLNPVLTVGFQIAEVLKLHKKAESNADIQRRVDEILKMAMPWDTMVGVARRSWARNENAMTTVAEYNKMYEGQDHITMPYLADDALCEKVVKEYLD